MIAQKVTQKVALAQNIKRLSFLNPMNIKQHIPVYVVAVKLIPSIQECDIPNDMTFDEFFKRRVLTPVYQCTRR